jgi:hypothetical protein
MNHLLRLIAIFLCAAACCAGQITNTTKYDVIIRNGRIIDGSGNPWYSGDIGVRDDRIAAIGKLGNATAARVIDASVSYPRGSPPRSPAKAARLRPRIRLPSRHSRRRSSLTTSRWIGQT